jgi:hypothetical protein
MSNAIILSLADVAKLKPFVLCDLVDGYERLLDTGSEGYSWLNAVPDDQLSTMSAAAWHSAENIPELTLGARTIFRELFHRTRFEMERRAKL